jgi:outer membrane lipoprotein SlyB
MNVKKITTVLLLGVSVVVFGSGCTRNIASNNYKSSDLGSHTGYQGVIISAEKVNVSETEKLSENTAGMAIGGLGGALAGSAFGKGKGQLLGVGLGALAGGAAGAFAEQALGNQDGMKYTVKLSNGQIKTAIQGVDNIMAVGQRVIFHESMGRDGRSRVTPDTSATMDVQQAAPAPTVVMYR